MEQCYVPRPFGEFAATAILPERYCVVDVGAAGGLPPGFIPLKSVLTGLAFDPDAAQMEALSSARIWGDVQFIGGYIGVPAGHPLRAKSMRDSHTHHNPWARLAVGRWVEIKAAADRGEPAPPFSPLSAFPAAPSPINSDIEVMLLPDVLSQYGISHIDFLKIDVDGQDWVILQSLTDYLRSNIVLTIGIEINWFGSDDPDDNCFHNVDRFLRGQGFDLYDVTTRRYSMKHLPVSSPTHPYPSCTHVGRLYQGDAVYARDLCRQSGIDLAKRLSDHALVKQAATFSMVGLPDCAAEILLVYRDRISRILNVDQGLELLAQEAHAVGEPGSTYAEIMDRFEASARVSAQQQDPTQ